MGVLVDYYSSIIICCSFMPCYILQVVQFHVNLSWKHVVALKFHDIIYKPLIKVLLCSSTRPSLLLAQSSIWQVHSFFKTVFCTIFTLEVISADVSWGFSLRQTVPRNCVNWKLCKTLFLKRMDFTQGLNKCICLSL